MNPVMVKNTVEGMTEFDKKSNYKYYIIILQDN